MADLASRRPRAKQAGMKYHLACLLAFPLAAAASDPSADAALRALKSADAETRIGALRELQTSLDPRIPEAARSLLSDEGNSIRRLAARAIGSRWWQISETGPWLSELKSNARSEFEDEANMAERAIGLLARTYRGKMFARSANGRWVVYERFNLPCLIDTKTGTEELLGWTGEPDAWLASSWGNGPTSESVLWHPEKDAAAFEMLLGRKTSAVWVWENGSGLHKLATEDIVRALGLDRSGYHEGGGFFVEPTGWKHGSVLLEVSYTVLEGDNFKDRSETVSWDPANDRLRVLPKEN